jgi:hypothetical protein
MRLSEAKRRGINVFQHELYGNGKITFGVEPGAKREDIVAVENFARQLGVRLTITMLARPSNASDA